MMGMCPKFESSRAARMAATRPSIMSEGATMSAPASACDTAVRARRGRGRALWASPSPMTPEGPVGAGLGGGPRGGLDDAAGVVGFRAEVVLSARGGSVSGGGGGQAEEEDGG